MNNKKGYRNMAKWREACHRQRLKYYRQTAYAKNHHQRWTNKEVEIVMAHEVPDRVISKEIGRSVASIQMKRHNENKKGVESDGRSPMDKVFY